jgi:hypothetical protein
MSANTIKYTDDSGEHTIAGITRYVASVRDKNTTIDFAPDYNARYTILAG